MSKIANAFKDGKAFIGFLTAGDPTIEKTVEYILAMEEAGCDLIEIGIPFSDPMAEGVVIQDANIRALGHNTTTDDVFEIVRKVRQKTDVPLVFLTYINPVSFMVMKNSLKNAVNLESMELYHLTCLMKKKVKSKTLHYLMMLMSFL